MSEFTTTFWGVRGGFPVPGKGTLEFGGNTTCLEVLAGSHLIIIDAGTGIINLGDRLAAQRELDRQPVVATVLFTHGHHDHTQGFPHFAPLYFEDSALYVLGPQVFGNDLEGVLKRASFPSIHPFTSGKLPSIRGVRNVYEHQVILLTQPGSPPVIRGLNEAVYVPPWAVRIQIYHSESHPKGGALCYCIEHRGKRLVFATDTDGYVGGDSLLMQFVHGADLLIHDAEYTEQDYIGAPSPRQGWGHSTWRMAVAVGEKANVKRLALTHHNANHNDALLRNLEKDVQAVFPKAFLAREGMTITL